MLDWGGGFKVVAFFAQPEIDAWKIAMCQYVHPLSCGKFMGLLDIVCCTFELLLGGSS